MEDKLKSIFSNVNDWLKFAETKNALMIPFSGVIIFGALAYLKADTGVPAFVRYYIMNLVIFQGLALTTVLCSFLPQTKIEWLWKNEACQDGDNLLFYGHIKKYDQIKYLEALYKANEKSPGNFTKMEKDYAAQIIINSKITARKCRYFKISFWFVAWALLTPILGVIVYLFIDPNQ